MRLSDHKIRKLDLFSRFKRFPESQNAIVPCIDYIQISVAICCEGAWDNICRTEPRASVPARVLLTVPFCLFIPRI